jgi:tetratricopeptide (TPR) repeat protein
VKRGLALTALLAVVGGFAAAAVTLVEHVRRDRYYRDLLRSGEEALAAGNAFAALEAFSGAVALRPDQMPGYYRRAEAYRQQRQFEKAAADLRSALRVAPDAPQPRIALGDLFETQGDYAQAASWYAAAAERLKDADPALLYRLASSFYRAGHPAAAIDPLKLALARNESFAEALYLLALAYRDTHQPDAAMASLEQAIRIAPHLTPAREELADLYRAASRSEDEIAQLQALSARDGDLARRLAIALAEARRGQTDRALAALRQEAERTPTNSRVDLAFGRVYLAIAERTGGPAVRQALEYLEKALGGTARRSEGLALFGRALHLSGNARDAERILQEAIATSPVFPIAFQYLADVADELGHPAGAREALLSLDALEGSIVDGATRLARARRIGLLSLRAGDARGAVTYLQQAVAGGLAGSDTLGALARARWASGDAAGAEATIDRALLADPANVELQRLARAIKRPAGRAGPGARRPQS